MGAHPFGGFNMSGTDSKAGGQDYLLLFTQGKSIGEKIIKQLALNLAKFITLSVTWMGCFFGARLAPA